MSEDDEVNTHLLNDEDFGFEEFKTVRNIDAGELEDQSDGDISKPGRGSLAPNTKGKVEDSGKV
jgi:hypothetical protein